MTSWRQLFGFQADEQPSYELVHDRWRERTKASENDQSQITQLSLALDAARRELAPQHLLDDTIPPEQLLPP